MSDFSLSSRIAAKIFYFFLMQRYHSNSIRCVSPPLGYTSPSRLRDWMSSLWMSLGQPNDGNFNTWTEMSATNLTGCLREAAIQAHVRCTESGSAHWAVRVSIWRRRIHRLFLFSSFLFFFGASVREPSGDRLVTQRPRVSTREYGSWNRTGERGRSGDMSEMVKQKQRDASSLTECQGTLIWESFSKAVYSLKNRACSSFRG